ncbi:MAG: CrcB family protein [Planctomycetes bacterium]|nr:CrcB family protein [Planctomycetota bacterium]
MKQLLLVCAGGALGSGARYLAALALTSRAGGIPWATWAVNAAGSFLIAFVMQLHGAKITIGDDARVFLVIGVLGGFTTYSSFNQEMISLYRSGSGATAAVYGAATLASCIIAGMLGIVASRFLID